MTEVDDRRAELKAAFLDGRGYWSPVWDDLLDLDPDFFDAFTRFSSVPFRTGTLEPLLTGDGHRAEDGEERLEREASSHAGFSRNGRSRLREARPAAVEPRQELRQNPVNFTVF